MSVTLRTVARVTAPCRGRYFATAAAARTKPQQPQSQSQPQPSSSSSSSFRLHQMPSLDTAPAAIIQDTHIGATATTPVAESPLVLRDASLGDVLLTKKKFGTHIHSVSASDKISVAMEMMNQFSIGAVLVRRDGTPADSGDNIVGIVSTRDYVRVMQEERLHPTDSPVSKFMTNSPVFAYTDDSALTSLDVMQQNRFRHLPVKDRKTGRIVGLVTIGDLVRMALVQLRESNIAIKDYLSGQY